MYSRPFTCVMFLHALKPEAVFAQVDPPEQDAIRKGPTLSSAA